MEGVVVHPRAILEVFHSLHCPQHILLFSLSVTEVSVKFYEQKIIFQTSELSCTFVAEYG